VTRRALLAAGAALAGALALALDGGLAIASPSPGELVAGAVVVAAAGAAGAAAARWGVRRTAFVLAPLALVAALVEVGLRWWFPVAPDGVRRVLSPAAAGTGVEGGAYRPHHYTLYTLNPRPGSVGRPAHHPLGLRDGRDLAPDPSAIRIVFLGGSTTYTVGVPDDARIFSARLERLLNASLGRELAGRRFEVVNAGLPGATSAENLIRLAMQVPEVAPDLVVIHHGLNDGWARAAGGVEPDYANYRRVWSRPTAFPSERPVAAGAAAWLAGRSMAVALAVGGAGLLPVPAVGDYVRHPDERMTGRGLDGSTTRYFERNTRSMVAIARSLGAGVVLATMAVSPELDRIPRRTVAEHNAVLAAVAERDGVPLFDFAAVMATGPEHMPDGRHVSQAGSDLKADLFHQFLLGSGIAASLAASLRAPLPATPPPGPKEEYMSTTSIATQSAAAARTALPTAEKRSGESPP